MVPGGSRTSITNLVKEAHVVHDDLADMNFFPWDLRNSFEMGDASLLPSELSLAGFAFPKSRQDHKEAKEEGGKERDLIETLGMQNHIEGGYFVETDRDPLRIPNPFLHVGTSTAEVNGEDKDAMRNASTSIFYLITPAEPIGHFHRNKGRTVHTLHQGRARYVLIHADRPDGLGRCDVETFVVGHDVAKGERLQWVVEGGKFKASFLLPVRGAQGEAGEGCLISETVVPGFEYSDHDFLDRGGLRRLVAPEQARLLDWLVRKE